MTAKILKTPRRLSVSTWSLRRALGEPQFYGVAQEIPRETHNLGAFRVLDLPAKLANFGIRTVEICHFHLPSRDADYLRQLRAELDANNIELWSLLIDDGDVSSAENGDRDANWIANWFPVAQALGAKNVRVIAGRSDATDENFARSVANLRALAKKAASHNLRLMTENWLGLLSSAQRVLELFENLDGEIGLCFDFGNWDGANKYEMLQQIAPLAESCHAKAEFFDENTLNSDDYIRCLELLQNADFNGPFTLINGTSGDEWRGLEIEKSFVQPFLN